MMLPHSQSRGEEWGFLIQIPKCWDCLEKEHPLHPPAEPQGLLRAGLGTQSSGAAGRAVLGQHCSPGAKALLFPSPTNSHFKKLPQLA